MTMTTIRAGAQDSGRLAPLFDGYRGFYGRASDLEGAERFLRGVLERDDSIVLFAAAAEDGAVLGFVQLYRSFSSLRMRPTLVLNDLFVRPDARRRGIARSLVRAARTLAREQGAATVQLETAKSNHSARALYVSEGYALDEEFDHYSLEP